MMNLIERIHKGVILDVSHGSFDSGAVAFATVFVDKEDPNITYLFYAGAEDTRFSRASIGLATSRDGINFRKIDELNPIIKGQRFSFCSKGAFTPAVTRLGNHFYMIFAGQPSIGKGRRLGLAYADDLRGPWRIIGELIKPKEYWEGNDIDLGPCIAKINESELIVYYSNVSSKWPLSTIFGSRFLHRRIGILKLKITSPSSIKAYRYEGNPLNHLNGSRGSWNEWLFCPGYLKIQDVHYLFPTASTYSVSFPHKQHLKQRIGMVTDSSPYFQKPQRISILIDGPIEKNKIVPAIRGEIALDAACPLLRKDKLFLYYGVMDRADGVWKTALTIFKTE